MPLDPARLAEARKAANDLRDWKAARRRLNATAFRTATSHAMGDAT
jgi:hypothetical protein